MNSFSVVSGCLLSELPYRSLLRVFYSIITNQSNAKLFLAVIINLTKQVLLEAIKILNSSCGLVIPVKTSPILCAVPTFISFQFFLFVFFVIDLFFL